MTEINGLQAGGKRKRFGLKIQIQTKLGIFDVWVVPEAEFSWEEAVAYAQTQDAGWRLPSFEELDHILMSRLLWGVFKTPSGLFSLTADQVGGNFWTAEETAVYRAKYLSWDRLGRSGRTRPDKETGMWLGDKRYMQNGIILIRDRPLMKESYKDGVKASEVDQRPIDIEQFALEFAIDLTERSVREKYHINNYNSGKRSRCDVFKVIKNSNKPSEGFIEAMLWGNIRPRNRDLINNLGTDKLNHRLSQLDKWIDSSRPARDIINEYLKNGSLVKIPGVGVSFITKYLYFRNRNRFLIYDRWIQNVHYAMLISDGKDPEAYFGKYPGDLTTNTLKLKVSMAGEAYEDFLERIPRLYRYVNEGLERRGYGPFQGMDEYEAFLFGKREIGYYSADNPRKLIAVYVHERLRSIRSDLAWNGYWTYYEHLFDI